MELGKEEIKDRCHHRKERRSWDVITALNQTTLEGRSRASQLGEWVSCQLHIAIASAWDNFIGKVYAHSQFRKCQSIVDCSFCFWSNHGREHVAELNCLPQRVSGRGWGPTGGDRDGQGMWRVGRCMQSIMIELHMTKYMIYIVIYMIHMTYEARTIIEIYMWKSHNETHYFKHYNIRAWVWVLGLWLSGEEHCFCRSSICISSSRSDALFWPQWTLHSWGAQSHV